MERLTLTHNAQNSAPVNLGTKTCPACGKTLPTESFYKDSHQSNGHRAYCKRCDNERRRHRIRNAPPRGYSTRFHRKRLGFKTRKCEVSFFRLCEQTEADPADLLEALMQFATGTRDATEKFMQFIQSDNLLRNVHHSDFPWLPVVVHRELKDTLEIWANHYNLTLGKAVDLIISAFLELDKLGEDSTDVIDWARSFALRKLSEIPN